MALRDAMQKKTEVYEAKLGNYSVFAEIKYDKYGIRRFGSLTVFENDDDVSCYEVSFSGPNCDFEVWAVYVGLREVFALNGGKLPEGWSFIDERPEVRVLDDYEAELMLGNMAGKPVEKSRYFGFVTCKELIHGWTRYVEDIADVDGYAVAYAMHHHGWEGSHVHFIIECDYKTAPESVEESFRDFGAHVFPVMNPSKYLDYIANDCGHEAHVFTEGYSDLFAMFVDNRQGGE